MPELKYILWDVDGTLADTERDGHRVAFNIAFKAAGLERRWDVPTYGKLLSVTGGKERIQFDIDRGDMPKMPYEKIAELHANKTSAYQQLIAEGRIPLRPGVRRLLEEAYEADITLGIATTTTPAALDALIEHSLGSEWFDRFAVLAAGDIVPAKKPAPDIYTYAMQKLGAKPEETIAMEDSENGCKSAQAAKLKCIITTNGYTANHDFTGAHLVVPELGEPDHPVKNIVSNPYKLQGLGYITLQHCQTLCAL